MAEIILCVAYRHEYSTYTYYRHHNILLMSIHGSNTDVRKMITVTMLGHKLYQVRLCWLISPQTPTVHCSTDLFTA